MERLEPGKGVLELIKALKISKSKSKLLIIGSSWFSSNKKTKYVDDLMREAKELGNQIQFTGYVDHKNIGEYYKIADVAIMPSIYQEAAGLVALEAQAAGLPIIISNVGGISEFVHPQSSLKINIDDNFINSLANMINEISLNKDLYNYEKKLSQQYINRFNIDEYSKKFIDVFNRFS
ncbi:MAG: glycosyltransferase family 4 protein [Thomasclavelia ramosa]